MPTIMPPAPPRPLPLIIGIGGVYISQSLVSGVALHGVPALLRAEGASLQLVGLSSLFMLPWACKFMWAPAVERYRLPAASAARRSRTLVLGGQLLLALLFLMLAACAMASPAAFSLPLLIGGLTVAALLAATVDVACDGYAIDQLDGKHRGSANVAQVGGSYIGFLIGGGLFLLLASARGWPLAMAAMAGLLLLFSLPLLRLAESPRPAAPDGPRPSLADALGRPDIRAGLLLTVGLGVGVRLVLGSVGPMLIDRGVGLTALAYLSGAGGVAAGLAGTALGGFLVRRAGAWRAVRMAVGLQALLLAGLAGAAATAPAAWLQALAAGLYLALACGFVALYSLLMAHCSPRQAGLDFSLFQCADALVAVVAGVAGGWLAARLGYGVCFAVAAAWTAGAVLLAGAHPAWRRRAFTGVSP